MPRFPMETLASLTARFPRPGRLNWIAAAPCSRQEAARGHAGWCARILTPISVGDEVAVRP
jgi:hypothetical protein